MVSCVETEKCGITNKYTIDLGSSKTKHTIIIADTCSKTIQKTLLSESSQRSLGNYLSLRYPDAKKITLDQDDFQVVFDEVDKIIAKKKKFKIKDKDVKIFATSIYRLIQNKDKLNSIFEDSGLELKVISAKTEVEWTTKALISVLKTDQKFHTKNFFVWSMGGQSTFIDYINKKGDERFYYYKDWGSYTSHRFAVQNGFEIEKVLFDTVEVKNQKVKELTKRMVKMAQADSKLKELARLISKKGASVFGVGGIHRYTVGLQLHKNTQHPFEYSSEEIENLLLSGSLWKSFNINTKFALHIIPNLAYIYSIMKVTGIKKVTVIDNSFSNYAVWMD